MKNKDQVTGITPDAIQLEHQILVLDAGLQQRLDYKNYRAITLGFIDDLLATLGMDPLGALGIYPAVDQRAPGWSFIQPITTSHISAHYFEKPGPTPHIRLDAYSCETVDCGRLIEVCDRHFRLVEWRATFIDRQIEQQRTRKVIDLAGSGARVISERIISNDRQPNQGGTQCRILAR